MNYQHAFHAGNFADLLKHAVLNAALASLRRRSKALTVIDTHAGDALYDLGAVPAGKTGEAADGVLRLMGSASAPPAFAALIAAVRGVNRNGEARFYPGSPLQIVQSARADDRLIACELEPKAAASLSAALGGRRGVEVAVGDGWEMAARRCPPPPADALVLIDPPYEAAGDGAAAVRATSALLARNRQACVAVWAPLKDLATWDALLGDFEDATGAAPMMVAEVRLRGLTDPTRMNGCAMVVVNPPDGVTEAASEAAQWIAREIGEPSATARVWSPDRG
jgi:23S rRNA (adenine2030-N6)-methyltransferase